MVVQCDLSLNKEVMPKVLFHYRSPLVTKKVQQTPGLLTKIYIDSGPRSIRSTKVNRIVVSSMIIRTQLVVPNIKGSASRVFIATQMTHWIIVIIKTRFKSGNTSKPTLTETPNYNRQSNKRMRTRNKFKANNLY